jgi:hypothetical protein
MEGILISGPDAKTLRPHETLTATLEGIGLCRIRVTDQAAGGAQARFEAPDAALREKSKTACGRYATRIPNSSPAPWMPAPR